MSCKKPHSYVVMKRKTGNYYWRLDKANFEMKCMGGSTLAQAAVTELSFQFNR